MPKSLYIKKKRKYFDPRDIGLRRNYNELQSGDDMIAVNPKTPRSKKNPNKVRWNWSTENSERDFVREDTAEARNALRRRRKRRQSGNVP